MYVLATGILLANDEMSFTSRDYTILPHDQVAYSNYNTEAAACTQ
jgi:hypothetical protein